MTAQMTIEDVAEPIDERDREGAVYDVEAIQRKWLAVWDEMDPFRATTTARGRRRFMVDMFPYPSGDLHMGHAEVFALADVIARHWWQCGYEVLNPMGLDSFGLPAENAAITQRRPAGLDLRQHREPGRVVQAAARAVDWRDPAEHQRPGVTTAGPSGCS